MDFKKKYLKYKKKYLELKKQIAGAHRHGIHPHNDNHTPQQGLEHHHHGHEHFPKQQIGPENLIGRRVPPHPHRPPPVVAAVVGAPPKERFQVPPAESGAQVGLHNTVNAEQLQNKDVTDNIRPGWQGTTGVPNTGAAEVHAKGVSGPARPDGSYGEGGLVGGAYSEESNGYKSEEIDGKKILYTHALEGGHQMLS